MKSLIGSIVACVLVMSCAVCFAEDKKPAAAKPINKKCPVEGGDVDPKLTTEYKGKTIGFCCESCPAEFKKDPAKFMAIVDKELAKDKPADKSKDAATKKSDEKDKKKEQKLNTKCPVSGDDVDKSITTDYKGRTIAFCCEECVKDFKKDPKKFVAKLEEQDKAAKKDADKSKDADKDKKAEK